MDRALLLTPEQMRWRCLIGTGGIGSGTFFALEGAHTLGREESRSGRFLERRDYCKLHIIAHTIQVLLGPTFLCYPIGLVGEDEPGRQMLREMACVGMDLRYVNTIAEAPTLFSICLVYPDGAGGNLTTADSASSRVGPETIAASEIEFQRWSGKGIALAAPEAPLAARQKLLELASSNNFFRVLAVNSAEARLPIMDQLMEMTDLLALNLDEAAALTGADPASGAQKVIQKVISMAQANHPGLSLSVTAGKEGSWTWDGSHLNFRSALPANIESTAGAGDAHLAGMISGLAAGLTLIEAHELAGLVSALSVTSPHTIHPALDRHSLAAFAKESCAFLTPPVARLLIGSNSSTAEETLPAPVLPTEQQNNNK